MELIYIGDKFYKESSTMMNSIYTVEWERSDWGKVQIALEKGEYVHIRPAIPAELKYYEDKLEQVKKMLAKERR